jgi:hypothetical protein
MYQQVCVSTRPDVVTRLKTLMFSVASLRVIAPELDYRGCFKEGGDRHRELDTQSRKKSSVVEPKTCIHDCATVGKLFAGLQVSASSLFIK